MVVYISGVKYLVVYISGVKYLVVYISGVKYLVVYISGVKYLVVYISGVTSNLCQFVKLNCNWGAICEILCLGNSHYIVLYILYILYYNTLYVSQCFP